MVSSCTAMRIDFNQNIEKNTIIYLSFLIVLASTRTSTVQYVEFDILSFVREFYNSKTNVFSFIHLRT